MGKTLGAAALAVAAAIKATGAHRYRFRAHSFIHDSVEVELIPDPNGLTLDEAFRAYEHAFFVRGADGKIAAVRPGIPVRLRKGFEVRVVPSK